jgi:N-acetylmuramoyl-L-alanine amidase
MRKLFLSAGHSLNETGAIANNFKEADLTIDLRNLIAQEIRLLN